MEIREYAPADERSWLRCRVLAFLDTCYYDDVARTKPHHADGRALVAVDEGAVVGLLDVAYYDDHATIETVAVHPDHRRSGIGTGLLDAALPAVRARGLATLDAWTREDAGALRWYAARRFVEVQRYVHVHAGPDEVEQAVERRDGLYPVHAFLHGRLADEDRLRARYSRVYLCHRFVRDLTTS